MKINRRETSGKVSISSPKSVKGGYRDSGGKITVQGKTKVSSGPAANGPCTVASLAGKRLGYKRK